MKVTFHKASDFIDNFVGSIEGITKLGFDNVLTQGGQNKLLDNVETLKKISK